MYLFKIKVIVFKNGTVGQMCNKNACHLIEEFSEKEPEVNKVIEEQQRNDQQIVSSVVEESNHIYNKS
jgi:hypothetical protein